MPAIVQGGDLHPCNPLPDGFMFSKPRTKGSESARWTKVLAQVFGELRSTDAPMAATIGHWVDHSQGTSARDT